jgi:SAM-dependent methyltransferase
VAERGETSLWEDARDKLKSLIFHGLNAGLGWDVTLDTDDRRVLDGIILPHLAAAPEFGKVLFVGSDWYTRRYNRVFADKEYWTIDKDPSRARYGASRHVTDVLQNLERHFPPGYFDLILCNGVLGWGLDDKDDAERAFAACWQGLREGGVFVLGWNNIPRRRPLSLEASTGLARFKPYVFAPLKESRYLTRSRNRHTFDFYVK